MTKLKIAILAVIVMIGVGGDAYVITHKQPHQEPTPTSEPVATPETTTSQPGGILNQPPVTQSSPQFNPVHLPKVDLDPYKYSVPLNAGGSVTSPTINIPDYQPWSYTATPPVITYPPVSNCHTILNC